MPVPGRAVLATTGFLALTFAATGASATFSPMLVPNMMQAVVLNPCQPGTPCGDAAAKKYNISPYKVLPPGGMNQVKAQAAARHAAGLGDYPTGAAAGGRAVAANPAATRYTPSPQVSAAIKAKYIQQVARTMPPDRAQHVAQVLGSRDLVGLWTQEMAPQGLHPNDMADAVASYWILNWIMANHADIGPAQARAVRNQIWRAMATGPIGRLPNADRQEMAELMMMQFVTESALYQKAVKSNDTATAQQMGDHAEARFRNEMKIDLRSIALTGAGFVRKS